MKVFRGIYTVVCHSLAGDEDSTVSFEDWDDAIGYVLNDELAGRDATKKEMRKAKAELYKQRHTVHGDWEYSIYDATLVTG